MQFYAQSGSQEAAILLVSTKNPRYTTITIRGNISRYITIIIYELPIPLPVPLDKGNAGSGDEIVLRQDTIFNSGRSCGGGRGRGSSEKLGVDAAQGFSLMAPLFSSCSFILIHGHIW